MYTIEFGLVFGFFLVGLSTLTLLLWDVLFFNDVGINFYLQSDIALCAIFLMVAWILGLNIKRERSYINQYGYALDAG